jgi:O-antigen/teichoic acid export membrane protein
MNSSSEAGSRDPTERSGAAKAGEDGAESEAEASDRRDLARGAGANYLGYVARLGARAPFLFLAGILYGEAAFGLYTFGTAVVETGAALALFGMKRSLSKVMSDAGGDAVGILRATATGIVVALGLGTLITLAVAAGAGPIALAFGLPGAARALLVLSLALPMIVLSDILLVAIRFTRQMRFEVYARSIVEPIVLTVSVVAAYALGVGDLGLVVGYVVALTSAALVTALFFVRLYDIGSLVRIRLRWKDVKGLMTYTGPTAAYELAILVANRADVFLVSYFTGTSGVGIYGMAREFSTVTKKIRQGFDPILRPVLSDSIAQGALRRAKNQLVMVSRWILSSQIPVILVFVFYADDVLGLLGSGFAGGAMILILLMAGDAVEGGLGVNEIPIVYLRPRANILIGILWIVTNVGLGMLLVPLLGPVGMAVAIVTAITLVNVARVAVNRLKLGIDTLEGRILKPLVAALPPALAVWALNGALPPGASWSFALGLPILLGGYVATLYLLGLEPEDRTQLRRLVGKFRGP